jgi:transposase InsO family protein
VKIREELILKVLGGDETVVDLAEQYGVSRKTIYKWLARYKTQGLAGLVDESRRPFNSPMKLSAEYTLEILQIRKEHTRWGPKKIAAILARRHPDAKAPVAATVARLLRAAGEKTRVFRRHSGGLVPAAPSYLPREPNDLWTVDFKGWWRTKDGERCEPLTVRDAVSRYVLALRLMTRTRGEDVRPVFEELFDRYGLPAAIQSDNGSPFASTRALGGLTPLSAWWVSLGIRVLRSRPGHPTDNGAHERMHVDVRFDLEDCAASTPIEQQRACDDWVTEFNHVRPHEALGLRLPGEVYRPSSRRPRSTLVVGGYPDGARLMKVDSHGWIRHAGQRVYLSTALCGRTVGLVADDSSPGMRVWYFNVLLGAFVPGGRPTVEPTACAGAA